MDHRDALIRELAETVQQLQRDNARLRRLTERECDLVGCECPLHGESDPIE